MRDKRPVDELSIEELERILAIRRREARQHNLQRMHQSGRMVQGDLVMYDDEPSAIIAAKPAETVRVSATPRLPASDSLEFATDDGVIIDTDVQVIYDDDDAPASVKGKRSKWYDRALIGVEVAAVLCVAFIGLNMMLAIRNLETETASAQAQADEIRRAGIPTIAPTPSLRAENYVLPGGHTITDDGAVRFNYDEVPEHLLPLVESQWIQPVVFRPPVTAETAVSVTIPRLQLNQTIVQGVDWEALKQGVGQLLNGVDPSQDEGNVVLAAHNDVYGELFRYLPDMQIGDEFQIQTQNASYTYVVTEVFLTHPNDVSVMNNRDGATATLISCYPYQVNDQRVIVYADRVG
jgi:sortase A